MFLVTKKVRIIKMPGNVFNFMVNYLIQLGKYNYINFNITTNPIAEWCLQQIQNLLFDYKAPKYLIRYRDMKYRILLGGKKNRFGIYEIITAYRSPW